MDGLFGANFEIDVNKPSVKSLVQKLSSTEEEEIDAKKLLKSKKLSLQERLTIITNRVLKVLGKQKQNVLVIRDKKTFADYISKAIDCGRIAIDTETNNSLDPVTCKLMGLCLYYSGGKQAYIPINHVNIDTGELLPNQLTTLDCYMELQRLLIAKTFIVMHNGKFDWCNYWREKRYMQILMFNENGEIQNK